MTRRASRSSAVTDNSEALAPQVLSRTGGSAFVVGDFNGDGRLDLALANSVDNNVTVLLGNGNGTFTSKPSMAVPDEPVALVTGDFDSDGHLDLAVARRTANQVTVLLGNGDGTFGPGGAFGVGEAPVALVAGDVNGDGDLDLAAGHDLSNGVTVLL